jgi:hypothetical protein
MITVPTAATPPSRHAPRAPAVVDRLLSIDLLFTFALLSVVALVRLRRPIGDADLGWHVATGTRMLEDLALPVADGFSYLTDGQPWIVDTWLADILVAACHQAFGAQGLTVAAALLIGLTFAVVQRACRAVGARHGVAFFATLLAALVSAPTWVVGPRLVASLMMATVVYALAVDRERPHPAAGARRTRLWLLIPTMALWANTHPTFLLGLIALAVEAVVRRRAWLRDASQGGVRWGRCALLLAVLLATLSTPYGVGLLSHALTLLADGARGLDGFASGLHSIEGQLVMALFFWTLLTMAISPARKESVELTTILPLALFACVASHGVPFFCVVTAPVLARHIEALLPARITLPASFSAPLAAARRGLQAIALGTCGILFAMGFRNAPASASGGVINPAGYPVDAVAFLKAEPALGRLFNHADWGGYLIDELYPHYQVSMDGRSGLYTGASRRAYRETERMGPRWREFFDECAPDVVLWRKDHPLIAELQDGAEWRRLYEDRVAVILVRASNTQPSPGVGPDGAPTTGSPRTGGSESRRHSGMGRP